MAITAERLVCPGCGFPVEIGMSECPAGHPLNIKTFNSVYSMPMPLVNKYANTYKKELDANPDDQETNNAIGICFLKLKLYDKALLAFEKAMVDNFDNSETFFYAAICKLAGKKAFVCQRADVDKAIEYLNAANMIEPKGIYYCLLAYLKYDFYKRKFLNVSPSYQQELDNAKACGLSKYDTQQLFSILNVDNPFNL